MNLERIKMDIQQTLAQEFALNPRHVANIIELIDEGSTIPFIARYRKEMTGSCDDQVLREFHDRLTYLRNLEKRKEEVLAAVLEQGKLTEEFERTLKAAKTLAEVEDAYRPYKPKRRTRATIAREKGLQPLAELILAQKIKQGTIQELALPFINKEKGVESVEDAVAGAQDIVAEMLSDDAVLRKKLRNLIWNKGIVSTKSATEEDTVYRLYYDFEEAVSKIPSHRILAINRGEKEGILKVAIKIEEASANKILFCDVIKQNSTTRQLVEQAAQDSWQRLLFPSLEREVRTELTDMASEQAIKMFGQNLKPTLMQPPLRDKTVLGLDPAYRTGCKIAVVDKTGNVLDTTVIYPTPPNNKIEESERILTGLIQKHAVDVIAIGNGTASKESELFIAKLIKQLPRPISYAMVNEAGASVYSASKMAAQEFPEFDVSLRSAVSIARRLQDPMAELVKIDPKAIGVGQYQHDMPQKRLDETLCGVVEDCVNSVGVDANTASAALLSYISGLTAATSANIETYRKENGAFTARTQLKKVPKLGPKAYEQCAGFLRIIDGKNFLDNTAVHPESYDAVKKLLGLFGYGAQDVQKGGLVLLSEKIKTYGEENVAQECGIGVPTLRDMVAELLKPGRDIRDSLPKPELRTDIMDMNDLKPGMELSGTVRNVIDFGAFVDIGVHQDGLVHISKMSNRYIKHPSEAAKVGDVVTVWVLSVDSEKKRISLSMVGPEN